MADVFAAERHHGMGVRRIVAIKRMFPHLMHDPTQVRMFVEEARLSIGLRHANIPHFIELGHSDGHLFLVMELIEGHTLQRYIERLAARRQRIPVPVAIFLAASVCRALAYLHTRTDGRGQPLGLVHRDVSPDNVLVSLSGRVKLIDFGIAKGQQRRWHTTRGKIRGKSCYLSPEQIKGGPVDGRADIFSLGCVLHELLTGRLLFDGVHPCVVARRVLAEPVVPPSELNPAVPVALSHLVLRALQRDPARRPQTAEELLAELETIILQRGWRRISSRSRRWLARHAAPRALSDGPGEATRPDHRLFHTGRADP
jgi:serine/threonine-protein kinase